MSICSSNTIKANHYFPGDGYEFVKRLQREMDQPMISGLFMTSIKYYEWAAKVLGVKTPLEKHIFDVLSNMGLQEAYDLIAAWFRFKNSDELHPLLPIMHPFGDEEHRVAALWQRFFTQETERLLKIHGSFLLDVLEAGAYAGSHPAYAAQKRLKERLEDEYGEMLEYKDNAVQ